MKIESVAFEISLDSVERAMLKNVIKFWYTGSYEISKRLFGDMDKTIALMNVMQQLEGEAIAIRVSRYQAKVLSEVIYNVECRSDTKGNVSIPKDCILLALYKELLKLAKD